MACKALILAILLFHFLNNDGCEGFSASATRKQSEMFGAPKSKFELGFEMRGRIVDCFYEDAEQYGKIQFSFRVR